MRNPLKIVLVECPDCHNWMETRNENKVPKHGMCTTKGVKPAGVAK